MSLTNSSPLEVARAASIASRSLALLSTTTRNDALTAIHKALLAAKETILKANARDVEEATKAAVDGRLSQSILGRLDLSRKGKWEDMLQGILSVRDLEDPGLYEVLHGSRSCKLPKTWYNQVGKTTLRTRLDEGLMLERVTCPIGVLLIIFEARPEVIANIASLAIKSGNAAILKGGKESTASFIAISTAISSALNATEVPNASIQLVTTRDTIPELLTQEAYIDLVIPRGSNDLVRYIKSNTRIPVLGHADGLCSIYVAADADKDMCVRVLLDAKTSYPSACNAVETLLVEKGALTTLLPAIATGLLEKGVSIRCDATSLAALKSSLPTHLGAILQPSTEDDYRTEFLSLILAVKCISASDSTASVDAAVDHINTHSSCHTDAILTASPTLAHRFQAGVDSACVFWNTSTRMADGMRFGFGTEVGISTNKIHARGPVGLEGLMIYKYLIKGEGQVSGDYGTGEGQKLWKHESLPLT
ncbi:hypothetical protein MMC15_006570 [Xylographa vitiligo]|nr:hypothetical protein [Xylographa vitiligo]